MSGRTRGERLGAIALASLATAVVGAAVADSLGKSIFKKHAQAKTRTVVVRRDVPLADRKELSDRLRRDRVSGVLYFVDPACRLHALRLPSLVAVPAPRDGGCRALVSPASAPPGWSLWPRNTPLAARCERGRVIVSATVGLSLPMIGGCAPAWRPDGSMTYIRRGAIVQFPRTGRAQVLRSQEQLARALERLSALHATSGWHTRRVAWLGPDRFAIVASSRERSVLAVFSGRRIVAFKVRVPFRAIELRASPQGKYLVLRTASGLRVYDARRPDLPRARRFGTPTAIGWSSDEDWFALASRKRVMLQGPRGRIVLPLAAIDLAWTRDLS